MPPLAPLEGFSRYQHMVISPEKSAVVVLLLTFVRFYLVLYLADFSGDIMFCERDLVRERDLVMLKPSIPPPSAPRRDRSRAPCCRCVRR